MASDASTHAAITGWFNELQACVRSVDYARARRIFAPEVVGFGTYASLVHGLDRLQAEQWSNIWPNVRDFTFRLDELHWGQEGRLAWAACPWDSVGFSGDKTPFARPGRVTVIFEQRGEAWLAIHTHFSLYPVR